MFVLGGWEKIFRSWEKKLNKAMRMHREDEPAMKTFDPVNENVPRLEEYGTDLGDAYWDKWSRGAAVRGRHRRAVQGEGRWPSSCSRSSLCWRGKLHKARGLNIR